MRTGKAAAITLATLACVGLIAASAANVALRDLPDGRTLQPTRVNALLSLGLLAFPVMGGLVAARRPRDPIGWLLIAEGWAFVSTMLTQAYAAYGLYVAPGSLPVVELVAWLAAFSWAPIWPLLLHLFIVFPDGRPLSPAWGRWIAVTWLAVGLVVVGYALSTPFDLGADRPPLGTAHPTGIAAMFAYSGLYLLVACMIAGAAAVIARFRRSRGPERLQIRWVAFAGAIAAAGAAIAGSATAVFGQATGESLIVTVPMIVGMGFVPFAVAIAVLRYRLYEIDLLINRTLVYGALSAVLLGAYAVLVVVFQSLLRPLTGGSEIAVAASTLAVVALVQPLRRRIQSAVDHRFYRSRYDASRTLDDFVARLRDEVGLDQVRNEVLEVIATTVRPAHAGLWLREEGPPA